MSRVLQLFEQASTALEQTPTTPEERWERASDTQRAIAVKRLGLLRPLLQMIQEGVSKSAVAERLQFQARHDGQKLSAASLLRYHDDYMRCKHVAALLPHY